MLHTINARLPFIVVLSAGLARRREGSAHATITRIATIPKQNARPRKRRPSTRLPMSYKTTSRRKGPMADSSIVTLRLPKSLLQRADSLIPALRSNSDIFVVGRLSRSVVLRLAVLRGLEAMEGDTPIRTTAQRAPAKKRAKR